MHTYINTYELFSSMRKNGEGIPDWVLGEGLAQLEKEAVNKINYRRTAIFLSVVIILIAFLGLLMGAKSSIVTTFSTAGFFLFFFSFFIFMGGLFDLRISKEEKDRLELIKRFIKLTDVPPLFGSNDAVKGGFRKNLEAAANLILQSEAYLKLAEENEDEDGVIRRRSELGNLNCDLDLRLMIYRKLGIVNLKRGDLFPRPSANVVIGLG